jgi:hypothetical protein
VFNSKIISDGALNETNTLWHRKSTNKRGNALEVISDQHNLSIMNGIKPNSRKSSNIIDLVICSDNLIQRINDINVDSALTESDHWPVCFTLDFNPAKSLIKKIDWKRF